MRFPASGRSFPTKDQTADFIEAYARRFGLPVRSGVGVDRLAAMGDRFVLTAGADRFAADNVVVATGAFRTPRIPAFAAELDPGIVRMHSSEYRNPSQLRDGGVLVVGAGNSGAEIALDVAQGDRPTWLSGRDTGEEAPFRLGSVPDRLLTPIAWVLFSRLLTVRTPAGRRLRRRALSMGWPLVRVKPKDIDAAGIERVPRTVGVRDGFPVLADARILDVANVIWCTGFRPDFGWIDLPVLDADGAPVHRRGVVASHPRPVLRRWVLPALADLVAARRGRPGRRTRRAASRGPSTAGPQDRREVGSADRGYWCDATGALPCAGRAGR
jgi:putative flavoprotein involved in K+ transport